MIINLYRNYVLFKKLKIEAEQFGSIIFVSFLISINSPNQNQTNSTHSLEQSNDKGQIGDR